ncbi:hypothetical protein ACWEO1_22630 [Kitasatospora cineracea]
MSDTAAINLVSPPAERQQQLHAAIQRAGGTWNRQRAWELYDPRPDDPKFVRRDLQALCRNGLLARMTLGEYEVAK